MSRLGLSAHIACIRCGETTPICTSDWIVDPFCIRCPVCERRGFYAREQLVRARKAEIENTARRQRRAFGRSRGTEGGFREIRA